MNFPGTNGKVKYVWLDNAPGKFSFASISLLKNLDPSYYYIIDCHWPLKVSGITVDPTHFYVCGCSGAYKCQCNSASCGRGYYEVALTINNNQYDLTVNEVRS